MKIFTTLMISSVIALSSCGTNTEAKTGKTSDTHQKVETATKHEAKAKTENHGISQNIQLADFDKIMASKKPILVDVRTPQEFNEGHIDGAININVMDQNFMSNMEKLQAKDKPLMLYCRSGNRSGRAMNMLKKAGYHEMYNLLGGYMGYTKNKK